MPEWTKAQEDAINALKGTVLVSAAAGSGKTAVLVERVIRRITDKENPIDADKFLIVTFTKASAAEMKERIENAIVEKLSKDPENKRLARQQILLSQANICTIDSFCAKIVREFFEKLNITQNFTVLTGKLQEQMKADSLNEAILEMYEKGNFKAADLFSSDKNDKRLFDAAMKLYNFTRSHLFPGQWLSERLSFYEASGSVFGTPFGKIILEHSKKTVSFIRSLLKEGVKCASEDNTLKEKFENMFASDINSVDAIASAVEAENWDEIYRVLGSVAFSRFPSVRGYNENAIKIRIKELRDSVKEAIKKLASYYYDTEEKVLLDIKATYPYAQSLYELVSRFEEIYKSKKEEKDMADYSDIEHYAAELFIEKDFSGALIPTEIARTVSKRYEEVMIDEYQDTNDVQDAIYRAISKDDTNRFMVGDVKQSIYGFREAQPEIFIKYKNSFNPYDRENEKYPAVIDLDRNFRSDKNVINTVNFFFSHLMTESFGGVDYKGREELREGTEKEEKKLANTEIVFIEAPELITNEQAEARYIAEKIKEIMASSYRVTEKGKERKPSYRDFAVLLRSANKYAFNYSEELMKNGIPARASVSSSFFTKEEVLTVLSFLQVIDNPNQDIPLVSVLLSPLYGFTADDMARLRLIDRVNSLYVSLTLSGEEKYAKVLSELENYRTLAATMSASEFISYFYAVSDYEDIVRAMENGEERLQNLRRLKQLASDFESESFMGVSGFVRFTEKLIKQGSDIESGSTVSESADAVKIMSIHKSKGLEFPVCFIAGCGKKFNFEKGDIVLNSKLGLGVSLKHPVTKVKYSGIVKDALDLENKTKEASEELRVFYVALTRAKDKLILCSTLSDIEKSLMKINAGLSEENSSYSAAAAERTSDWIMTCALKHPDGKELRKLINAEGNSVSYDNYSFWDIKIYRPDLSEKAREATCDEKAEADIELYNYLKEKCDYVYPYKQVNTIPSKVTATQLTSEFKNISLPRPGFMSYKGLTPAERGIALHSFMQFADFKRDPLSELERLISEGYITKEQGESVNISLVRKFLVSPLGVRIKNAEITEKEFRFSVNVNASIVNPELSAEFCDLPVILQGAIDCYFIENGKVYIVDFKTDRVNDPGELINEYGTQLKLYANALTQILDYPLGGCYIFSLHLSQGIEIIL